MRPDVRQRYTPAALYALAFVLLLRPIADPDIWFHLTIGREVLARGAVPPAEFYVLPLMGEPGRFHEWGFGALAYLAEALAGHAGLGALNAALGAAILTFLFLAARVSARERAAPALLASAVVLALMEFRLVYRPESLLYLALAAQFWLLENYLRTPRPAWLAPLPAIAWLLSQAHPSVPLLICVLGAYGVQAVADSPRKARTAAGFAATALAMLLAAALNPYGMHQLTLPLAFGVATDFLAGFTEFLPALDTAYRYHFLAALALAGAALACARPRRWVDVIIVAAFAWLAWRHVRHIALLALALGVPLTRLLAGRWPQRLAWPAAAAWLLAGGATLFLSGWGTGVDPRWLPARAAAVIREHVDAGPVFSFLHLGNYLAWDLGTRYPVSIDGRNFGPNAALALHDTVFRADAGWERRLDAGGYRAIVTPATLPYSGDIVPLVAALENHPQWALAAREEAALLFLRRDELAPAAPLASGQIWRQAVEELERNLRENPGSAGSRAALAYARNRLAAGR